MFSLAQHLHAVGIPSPTGKPHPRLYGTFPRVLGRYVREEGLLSLEEAVRRMTSLPNFVSAMVGYRLSLTAMHPA